MNEAYNSYDSSNNCNEENYIIVKHHFASWLHKKSSIDYE